MLTVINELMVSKIIDVAITAILGDKISAARQQEINLVISQAVAGEISDEQAYAILQSKEGDELDKVLGNVSPTEGINPIP